MKIALALILTIFASGSIGFSQPMEPFTVRIAGPNIIGEPSAVIDLPINLETGWMNLASFSFLIAYPREAVTLVDVRPGPLHGECGWQLLESAHGTVAEPAEYIGLIDTVRVIAVARTPGSQAIPDCYHFAPKPFPLFTLRFRLTTDDSYSCQNIPVRFYWTDCGDNRISVPASVTPVPHNQVETIAQSIFEPGGWSLTHSSGAFPSFFGPNDSCVTSAPESPVPFINLVNGGASVRCPEISCAAGDLNMNGTPFEIEDSWLFTRHLLYGDTVFNPYASDVNHDGTALGLDDFVFMMRIVTRDYVHACPLPCLCDIPRTPFHHSPPTPGSAELTMDDNRLTLATTDKIIAAQFIFDDEITPELFDAAAVDINFVFDGEVTRVLLYGFFTNQLIESGPILQWTGDANLISASLATTTGGQVELDINH